MRAGSPRWTVTLVVATVLAGGVGFVEGYALPFPWGIAAASISGVCFGIAFNHW